MSILFNINFYNLNIESSFDIGSPRINRLEVSPLIKTKNESAEKMSADKHFS